MKRHRHLLATGLLLWFAAVLHQEAVHGMALFGMKPDLLLTVSLTVAVNSTPKGGALAGFLGGWLQGALAGANLTHYILTRTVTCFLASLAGGTELKVTMPICAAIVALATILAQVGLMFLAPSPDLAASLRDTMGTALYNGLLSMPLFGMLRPMFQPKAV